MLLADDNGHNCWGRYLHLSPARVTGNLMSNIHQTLHFKHAETNTPTEWRYYCPREVQGPQTPSHELKEQPYGMPWYAEGLGTTIALTVK
jgi:hypothetical protein